MKVGFTGTRQGMSKKQFAQLIQFLEKHKPEEFHHGDCNGADDEAHHTAVARGVAVVIHPPSNDTERAYNMANLDEPAQRVTILLSKPYLTRNKDIVNACDILLAAPKGDTEELRSGTWATVRHARALGKPVIVFQR